MANKRKLYNAVWDSAYSDLQIEMECIRRGGVWKNTAGVYCGAGLSHHYERMRNIIWPWLKSHRWHVLIRDTMIKSKVTVLMGPKSCGKTHEPSWYYLCKYWVFPDTTCVLISSTHIDGLRLRVWAEMCMLWSEGVSQFPELAGHLIDSKLLIATDDLRENDIDESRMARDWRKGIKGVACEQNGKFIGLAKFKGIKQKNVLLIADEADAMGPSFLNAFANLNGNENFEATICGNPNDPADQLGRAAEPKDGWSGHTEPKKTEVWDTKFMDGKCINLVGTDSPNFDPETKDQFKFLINQKKINDTLSFFPKDSFEYLSQCVGIMKIGVLARRVVEKDTCIKFGALNDAIWADDNQTLISAVDSAYGGDRCIGGHAKFGMSRDGVQILQVFPPVHIPIVVRQDMTPEDQISSYVKNYCAEQNVPNHQKFIDECYADPSKAKGFRKKISGLMK